MFLQKVHVDKKSNIFTKSQHKENELAMFLHWRWFGCHPRKQNGFVRSNSGQFRLLGRIWWPEATRLEDPLEISNGT
jgi:hypothetical protein